MIRRTVFHDGKFELVRLLARTVKGPAWFLTIILLAGCANEVPEDWEKPINYRLASYFLAGAFNWTRSFPAFRVAGEIYGVGTHDLMVFFLPSKEGHILINTGVEGSFHQIKENIESLGYDIGAVKILLTMQAHWDHVAEFARIKHLTGAQVWATKDDAALLEDGGISDPHMGGETGIRFRPVEVDRIIQDGELISVGDIFLRVHEHPGHTPGSASYSTEVIEDGVSYQVAIVNMASRNPGVSLIEKPTYPGIDKDFATTLEKQQRMDVDIWVSAHAGFFKLHEKYQPGDTYEVSTFYDPEGYDEAIETFELLYREQRQSELDE